MTRRLIVQVVSAACLFAGLAAGTVPATAAGAGRAATGSSPSASSFWTQERMAAAVRGEPADNVGDRLAPSTPEVFPQPKGREWKKGGLVARTTGKLFVRKNGKDRACSGVVVDTRTTASAGNSSTVLTAAHCLYSRKTGELSTMVSFVPGYTSSILNSRPYGTFDAIRLMPNPSYISSDGPRYLNDFGFVVVRKNNNGTGQLLQPAVNGGLEFSPPGGTVAGGKLWNFGYPSNIKGGVRLVYCSGIARESRQRDLDVMDCDMKEGASGGPLLLDFDPDTGVGKVVSVHAVGDRAKDIAGFPRLGLPASELFEDARQVPVS